MGHTTSTEYSITYEANQLYKEHKLDEAIDKLNEKNSSMLSCQDHFLKGKIFLKRNLIEKALTEFEICNKMDPKNETDLELALYYRTHGDKQKEFDALSEGLKKNNNIKEYYYFLALYHYNRKEYKKAKENLTELFKKSRGLVVKNLTEIDFKILKAKVHYALNDDEPLEQLKKEMKEADKDEEYHFTRYEIFKDEYNYKKAKEEIEKAIDKLNSKRNISETKFLKYLCYRISIDYYLNNYQEVIDKFLQLLKENNCGRFTTTIYFYLASSYRHLEDIKKYEEFIALYQENNGIENEEYCLEQALFAFSNNKDEEFEKWIQKSLDINDKYIPTIYFKISYLLNKGKEEEASELENLYKDELNKFHEKGSYQSEPSNINSPAYTNKVDNKTITEVSKTEPNENISKTVNSEKNTSSSKKELIGKGGFSKVYLETTSKGEKTIIKTINSEKENIKEMEKKLKDEANFLEDLEHRNIINCKGYSLVKNEIYMEYAEGGDLEKLLKTEKDLPEEFRIYLIKQIAEGLDYLHEKKIRHGDLKPENILLSTKYKEGESYPIPKIADFGLSSYENEVKGYTSRYAPPEVLEEKEVSLKSDIFSFGMTMFHILKGEKPFVNSEKIDASNLIKEGITPDLTGISSGLASIIKKTLNFHPSKRPSIKEVLDDLKN